MRISLAAAEKVSDLIVFGFGFGLVFVGLICIIAICSIMGALCKKLIQEKKAPAEKQAAPAANGTIENKGEFVAAVAAAIAEETGKDVKGIRIHSIKKL